MSKTKHERKNCDRCGWILYQAKDGEVLKEDISNQVTITMYDKDHELDLCGSCLARFNDDFVQFREAVKEND